MSKLTYVIVAVAAFITFLVFMMPAATLHAIFEEDLQRNLPDVELAGITGSVWDGQGDLQVRQFPPVTVDWQLSPLRLLTGTARTGVSINGEGLSADLDALFSSTGGEISGFRAIVGSHYLNQITTDYGLDLSGEVQLKDASLVFSRHWLTQADGSLHWTGGIIHIETPQQIHTVKLPALNGSLFMVGENLKLQVTQAGTEMMDVTIKPDGWATVAIEYALVDLINLPVPGADGTEDRSLPAIVLEEKIL